LLFEFQVLFEWPFLWNSATNSKRGSFQSCWKEKFYAQKSKPIKDGRSWRTCYLSLTLNLCLSLFISLTHTHTLTHAHAHTHTLKNWNDMEGLSNKGVELKDFSCIQFWIKELLNLDRLSDCAAVRLVYTKRRMLNGKERKKEKERIKDNQIH